jgi:hypothetical protein
MKAKAKRPHGRQKIAGLERINITLTRDERSFLETLGDGKGVVAGIRAAISIVKNEVGIGS